MKERSGDPVRGNSAKAFLSATTVFPHGMLANTPAFPMKDRLTPSVSKAIPKELNVYDFEFKPAGKPDFRKSDAGKIVRATGPPAMHPYEFVELGMLGINPKERQNQRAQLMAQGDSIKITGTIPAKLSDFKNRPA